MKRLLIVWYLIFPILAHGECQLQFSMPNDTLYQEKNVAEFVAKKIRPLLQEVSTLIEIDIHQTCTGSPENILRLKMDQKNYYILAIQGHDMTKDEYTYQTSSLPLSLKELNNQVAQAIKFEALDLKSKQNAVKEIAFFLAESARFSDVEQIVTGLTDSHCSQDWLNYAHLVRRWSKLSNFASATKLDTGTIHGGNKNHLIAPITSRVITKYNEAIQQGKGGPNANLIDPADWNNPVEVAPPTCIAS